MKAAIRSRVCAEIFDRLAIAKYYICRVYRQELSTGDEPTSLDVRFRDSSQHACTAGLGRNAPSVGRSRWGISDGPDSGADAEYMTLERRSPMTVGPRASTVEYADAKLT